MVLPQSVCDNSSLADAELDTVELVMLRIKACDPARDLALRERRSVPRWRWRSLAGSRSAVRTLKRRRGFPKRRPKA